MHSIIFIQFQLKISAHNNVRKRNRLTWTSNSITINEVTNSFKWKSMHVLTKRQTDQQSGKKKDKDNWLLVRWVMLWPYFSPALIAIEKLYDLKFVGKEQKPLIEITVSPAQVLQCQTNSVLLSVWSYSTQQRVGVSIWIHQMCHTIF